MIRHHPDKALLLAHAAGAMEEATALIVATHLAFCANCRRLVARAEAVGAARLEDIMPVDLRDGALDRTLARLGGQDRPVPAIANDNAGRDDTPAPLRAFLGQDLSQIRWRKMGPRLAYVPLGRRGPVTLRLLRGAPGTDVGRHSHHGKEYTLVLSGGYTDVTGTYAKGDFQTATPGVSHNPIADDDGDCINLAVTTAPLRFEGVVQKIAGKLFGF